MTASPDYYYLGGQRLVALDNQNDGTKTPVFSPSNIATFRDAFETYNPNVAGGNWNQVLGSGDLVFADGNAAGASYLVISKNPLVAGNVTQVETRNIFSLPIELAVGLSMSQRTLGQDFSVEIVDTQDLIADTPDIAIASITQATTTLTVETVTSHNLSVGRAIGIRDCSNQLVNYPSLVVASIISPTVFTVTAGPGGTIASQTITNPAGAKGFVYIRQRLGRAQNGVSQIFENATVTNSSMYLRSESGDAYPSGTVAGNQSVTIGTTASVALASGAYTYAWSPTNEFRITPQSDRTQWSDAAVDSLAASTARLLRNQVCPDPSVSYKLRFRAENTKALTVPNAQIVSAVKTGTTTATITTDVPHNLVTNDVVVVYGIRDQAAASFPNLTTATAVTVTGANTFTITIGTAATVTSYGGYVAKVQGGNLMSALGGIAQVVQSISMQTQPDGTRQLAVVGSASWSGVSIGDLVNLVGVRDNVTGATLNLDGAWKVGNISAANLFLVPPSASYVPPVAFPANTLGTTITAASNAQALPQATINVGSTAGYPTSGTFWVLSTGGWQLITYTGTTGTTFTGCTGGTGTLFTGQSVFGVVAAGGGVIRRTDLRISYARLFDYERERVELMARPAGDIAASVPVSVNNVPAITVNSGTITTVTTVTTVSTVTTVAAVTSANLGIPGTVADVASAALTTTTTTAAFTPTFGTSYEVNIPVTAVTGTTPTLDVSIEESDDAGTNWFKVYDFPRITAIGIYRSPKLPLTGNRVRYVQTVGGTTPSFTRAINRLQGSDDVSSVRQLVDRSVVLTTLNSTTPSINVQNCRNAQLVVNVGAITTTAPALQLQGSDDNGASWYNIGTPLTAVASSTVQLTVNNLQSQLLRANVSTAGVGVTAGYVLAKGF